MFLYVNYTYVYTYVFIFVLSLPHVKFKMYDICIPIKTRSL